jgi:hypothetical protein
MARYRLNTTRGSQETSLIEIRYTLTTKYS